MFHRAVQAPEQREFLPRIESLRGVAAMAVALTHVTLGWIDGPSRGALDAIGLTAIKGVANGYGAVVAFFVISGFVLARSLDRDFSAARFARARIFRLFPAAITTVAIFAALFYGYGLNLFPRASFTPLNIVANMLMLRSDIDAVMWSMKAELVATPLIFFCVWLFRRYGPRPLIAVTVLLLGLSFIGQFKDMLGEDTNLSPLYAFPVGILLHFRAGKFAKSLASPTVVLAALAAIAAFCASSFFKPTGTWMLIVECISAATLIMLVAYRPDAKIFAPLDLPIVRFYGRISYSFYLLHPLSLWITPRVTASLASLSWLPISLNLVISMAFSVAMITPLAWLSWRYVERPAVKWGARFRAELPVSGDLRAPT
jgi:peptidoglycan/LPS O-acetylase OafA/YrhL